MEGLVNGAAKPRTGLNALLEESAGPTSSPRTHLSQPNDEVADEAEEVVPTLSSLLLSTAAGLATRTKQPPKSTTTKHNLVLPSINTKQLESLLDQPSSTTYLSSLLELPLASVQALPSSLESLSHSLDTDLSSLAFTRYSAFLLSHQATVAISASFTSLSTALSSLLDSTASLETAAGAFEDRVHAVRLKRARMARVRERIEEVEELLEAPAVVIGCVRAGYWAEAIDVAVRLAELHARLSLDYDSPTALEVGIDGEGLSTGGGALLLLNRVRDEVSVALLSLRARVLESLLQRALKLPGAVRGVGILRRIGQQGLALTTAEGPPQAELDEDALRIVFLAARWRCLRGELEAVEGQMAGSGINLASQHASAEAPVVVGAEENDERTRWTKRWIEVWREVVGESIGMYDQVFLLDHTRPSSEPSYGTTAHQVNTTLPAAAPLNLFLASALSSLSNVLSAALAALTSASSLSALLTQLSYCSHSFARHGLDFRELLQIRQRVEARVGEIVLKELEAAGVKWEKEWRDGWAATARRGGRRQGGPTTADWLVVPEGLGTVLHTALPSAEEAAESSPALWHHQPPAQVALLPPLARFLNAHANALNALRLLPPLSLAHHLLAAQARELDRATQVLAAFIDAWHGAWAARRTAREAAAEEPSDEDLREAGRDDDERRLVAFAVGAVGRWVVPWCEAALRVGVYGEVEGVVAAGRAKGVVEAMARAEGLVAKVEGRQEQQEEGEVQAVPAPEEAVGPSTELDPAPARAPAPAEELQQAVKPVLAEPVASAPEPEAPVQEELVPPGPPMSTVATPEPPAADAVIEDDVPSSPVPASALQSQPAPPAPPAPVEEEQAPPSAPPAEEATAPAAAEQPAGEAAPADDDEREDDDAAWNL